jgi:hypothetical protein
VAGSGHNVHFCYCLVLQLLCICVLPSALCVNCLLIARLLIVCSVFVGANWQWPGDKRFPYVWGAFPVSPVSALMSSQVHCAFIDARRVLVDLMVVWGDVPMITADIGDFLKHLFGTEVCLLVTLLFFC